jgi:23S rRNA (cytidine1920-2'-O)/16S rRNA (cytidine1409-2'-O)-methyltransferase
VSIDVSFISLSLILPALRPLMAQEGELVCLIKPQFEAGKGKVGKNGVVRDPAVHLEVLEHFLDHAAQSDFTVRDITFSPIRGPEGNIEYLGWLSVQKEGAHVPDLRELVEQSHTTLEKTP